MARNTKGLSAHHIVMEHDRAKMFREKMALKNSNEDTIIRTNIHGIIAGGINDGKSKDEIIEILKKDEKNLKYEMFFESWINNENAKVEQIKERQAKKEQEEHEQ